MKLSEESSKLLNLCLNTRCNYCRGVCPFYESTAMEFDSPRAKLELIYEAITECIDEKEVVRALPDCKDCIKCQDACPHKINLVAIFQEFKSLVGFEK